MKVSRTVRSGGKGGKLRLLSAQTLPIAIFDGTIQQKKNGVKVLAGHGINHEQHDIYGRQCLVEQRISV